MGRGLLPRREHGPQRIEDLNPDGVLGEDATIPVSGRGQHPCPCDGIHALGEELLAGEGVGEEVSSCTPSGRTSKRLTGSLQRLNSPEVPSKWNYSMIL